MLDVRNDTGRLRTVLVHEPGGEVDQMIPSMMEELLFDDIVFGAQAREEHARFRQVLERLRIEVVEALDLLGEALVAPEARAELLAALDPDDELRAILDVADPATLAALVVEGVRRPEIRTARDSLFLLPPAPNWCFQRDPQVVIGDAVLVSAMATDARAREALLTRTIYRHHPRFASTDVLCDVADPARDRPMSVGLQDPWVEGGDVLVLSPDVVAIGYSARTNSAGIREVARALKRRDGGPRWLVVVELPARRAYMHLDTVITPTDRDQCLVHAPVILASGHGSDQATVYEVDLHAPDLVYRRLDDDLLAALARHGLPFEPIVCGGEDLVDQQREQWTDGANTLALAPGVVTLYERNVQTIDALDRAGYAVIGAEALLDGEATVDLDAPTRTCIVMPANELTRARGGPHCLSHALRRDAV